MDIKMLFAGREALHGREIEINGWVRTNRASGRFGFLEVNDGTFFKSVQVVYENEFLSNFSEISKIAIASAVTVRGILELTPQANQPFEIKAREVIIEASSAPDYPLQKKRHSMEFLREIAHLRPRSNTFSAVFRVRSIAAYAIHRFFQERGFLYVHSPILTGSDAEGAGEMFRVTAFDMADVPVNKNGDVDYSADFFGKPASLTVSGQLEAEIFALAFKNVYTFGPTFRAENSNTARHAAEFWMVEPEIAFADLNDDMNLAEDMLKYIIRYVMENAAEEMNFFNSFISKGITDKLNMIINSQFGRITYTEAVDILKNSGRDFEYPVEWGMDLQTEHERYLAEEVFKKPVFVTDYPKDIKAFYMRLNDDGRTVAAADLLAPGIGEIIGGSQREERLDVLKARMKETGMEEAGYEWYLDLRKYGGVKHAGFGLGFERIVMYMTGMSNIRDVLPFPRTPKSLEF
ncbi:MAG: asparagine--tRNA ligase [Firmicutes bacterium]|nr:asparagine--tRNA ligase [Bacillota bacterium]